MKLPLGRGQVGDFDDGANLYGAFASAGDAAGDVNRLVEIFGFAHVEAAELFTSFGEWAIRDEAFAIAHPDGGGGGDGLQRGSAQEVATGLESMASWVDSW